MFLGIIKKQQFPCTRQYLGPRLRGKLDTYDAAGGDVTKTLPGQAFRQIGYGIVVTDKKQIFRFIHGLSYGPQQIIHTSLINGLEKDNILCRIILSEPMITVAFVLWNIIIVIILYN